MGKEENEFLKKLQKAFKLELEERLKSLAAGLVELEKTPKAEKYEEIVEVIFREAHSLKGAARSASMWDIERAFQALENVFSALKRKEIHLKPELFDLLHRALNTIALMPTGDVAKQPGSDKTISISKLVEDLLCCVRGNIRPLTEIRGLETGTDRGAKPDNAANKTHELELPVSVGESVESVDQISRESLISRTFTTSTSTVRIQTEKLDSLMLQAEDMLQAKLLAMRNRDDVAELLNMLDFWKKDKRQLQEEILVLRNSIKTEQEKLNCEKEKKPASSKLTELIELDQRQARLFEEKLSAIAKSAEHDRRSIGAMVDTLLEDIKNILMLPVSSFLEIVPKIARDLSRDQKKEVQVVMEGGEIEIDKRILEEMKVPIIHILRNCIDHGIEKPEIRERNKKPKTGTISFSISQVNGNKVEICVSDDGIGIDIKKLKKAVAKQGILTEERIAGLDEKDTLSLVFLSEVTTSPIVTDISGRGLGLAIVKEKVEKLGGSVSIESRSGVGVKLRILLPITLATFRGILIEAAEQLFIAPTMKVERVARVHISDVKTVENRETITLDGKTVPLVRLKDVLELSSRKEETNQSDALSIMTLGAEEKRIAFVVDQVLGEEEVLFKSLGRQLSRVKNIYGATVLGTGKVAPILNAEDLMACAVNVKPVADKHVISGKEAVRKKLSVMVVEDSVTSRMLLKNILESAGYIVKTTVDGLEALTELKEGSYDLVVSDIDMPRMNGFVLTSKIRDDKKLAEMPVVLVTALDSRDDRERGIEVGANAYIVKSSFDQSNLLEVIHRLI